LQNIVSFVGLFCKRNLCFQGAYESQPPHIRQIRTIFHQNRPIYAVATICRLLNIKGLFCKRALEKRRYSAKETYNLKEPTNYRHSISDKYVLHLEFMCVIYWSLFLHPNYSLSLTHTHISLSHTQIPGRYPHTSFSTKESCNWWLFCEK